MLRRIAEIASDTYLSDDVVESSLLGEELPGLCESDLSPKQITDAQTDFMG